jgi:hypothetical protein
VKCEHWAQLPVLQNKNKKRQCIQETQIWGTGWGTLMKDFKTKLLFKCEMPVRWERYQIQIIGYINLVLISSLVENLGIRKQYITHMNWTKIIFPTWWKCRKKSEDSEKVSGRGTKAGKSDRGRQRSMETVVLKTFSWAEM